jgi:hypothetical protein
MDLADFECPWSNFDSKYSVRYDVSTSHRAAFPTSWIA